MNLTKQQEYSPAHVSGVIYFAALFGGLILAAVLVNYYELIISSQVMPKADLYFSKQILDFLCLGAPNLSGQGISIVNPIVQLPAKFLSYLVLPQLIASFNMFVLSELAGGNRPFFARALAISSLFWLVGGVTLTIVILTLTPTSMATPSTILQLLAQEPLGLIAGCLSQIWYASCIIKSKRRQEN